MPDRTGSDDASCERHERRGRAARVSRYLAQADREAIGVGGFVDGPGGSIKASYVVIDVAALPSLSRPDRFELYLHELGHAAGLAHVSDPAEVMYPRLQSPPLSGYGPGDLGGLAILGKRSGCSPAA
ncbi:MAG TPA: matrixin family metalloprotease [Actinomycetes bacterium]